MGGKCNHPRCQGGPCNAYKPEVYTPTEDDKVFAEGLIKDGWVSCSRKYGHIVRWRGLRFTSPELVMREDAMAEPMGKMLAKTIATYIRCGYGLLGAPEEDVERMTITPAQMAAFKKLGGDCAR